MNQRIKDKLAILPDQPGCYLMKDRQGTIIYVGKAKVLKNRVRSYFNGSHDGKTLRLVNEIEDFEYIVTSSNIEALILELTLIKKHDPKYNVMLKDDKTYPFIKLTAEKHPKLIITRKVKKDSGKYFGPYPNVIAAMKQRSCLIEFIRCENATRCQIECVSIIIWGNVWHLVSLMFHNKSIKRF